MGFLVRVVAPNAMAVSQLGRNAFNCRPRTPINHIDDHENEALDTLARLVGDTMPGLFETITISSTCHGS